MPGEQHYQAVDTYPQPTGWRHSILQCLQKILISNLDFLIPNSFSHLLLKPFSLVYRVVQFSEGIGNLHPVDKSLKPFHQALVPSLCFRQWRHLCRIVNQEGRLDEVWLDKGGNEFINKLSPPLVRVNLHPLLLHL